MKTDQNFAKVWLGFMVCGLVLILLIALTNKQIEFAIPIAVIRSAGEACGKHWAATDKSTSEEKAAYARLIRAELAIPDPNELVLADLTFIAMHHNPDNIEQATISHLVQFWFIRWEGRRELYSGDMLRAYFGGFADGIGGVK